MTSEIRRDLLLILKINWWISILPLLLELRCSLPSKSVLIRTAFRNLSHVVNEKYSPSEILLQFLHLLRLGAAIFLVVTVIRELSVVSWITVSLI